MQLGVHNKNEDAMSNIIIVTSDERLEDWEDAETSGKYRGAR
jgi:hypothetical protein